MVKVILQLKRDGKLFAYSREDREKLKAYRPSQLLTAELRGTKKTRSIDQNRWIHAVFRETALNSHSPDWDTPEKVKRNVKMAMKFFKDDVVVHDNKVFFELRSFAFDKMDHMEACRAYDQALQVCADYLGVRPEELQSNALQNSL